MNVSKKYNRKHDCDNEVKYEGCRGVEFNALIVSLLERSNIKKHYIDFLTSDENFQIYKNNVFVSKTFNKFENYEVFEQQGDAVFGCFIVWYIYRRYPTLERSECVQIVARIKIKYGSKKTFSMIADKLGFWKYISASENERLHNKKDLLEDVFEAFIGATTHLLEKHFKIGVGYAIAYDILKSIFDEIDISFRYEDLYDAITRLKEIFDYYTKIQTDIYQNKTTHTTIGTIRKIAERNGDLCTVSIYRVYQGKEIFLGTDKAALKDEAEQKASQQAIVKLNKMGFFRPLPDIFTKYCQ